MGNLVLAALFMLATHIGVSSTSLRRHLIDRIHYQPYLALYSIVAFIAFAWLIIAYGVAPYVPLWDLATWHAWFAVLLMACAFMLLISGLTSSNPTLAGSDAEKNPAAASGPLRITRHPAMWSFGLFGIAHMVANGDLASLILFGSVTVLALAGTVLIDRRHLAHDGETYRAFVNQTSNLPFAAILAGRQHFDAGEIGWWRPALGVVALLATMALHPLLFNAPVFFVL